MLLALGSYFVDGANRNDVCIYASSPDRGLWQVVPPD
jgi:hypothetical protein